MIPVHQRRLGRDAGEIHDPTSRNHMRRSRSPPNHRAMPLFRGHRIGSEVGRFLNHLAS
jgi:hypothetical protein